MILGVDSGQTALKAVVFDDTGHELGSSYCSTTVETTTPHWAERDMAEAATQLDMVIRGAVLDAGATPEDIRAVGVVGHGDGAYPVDINGQPTRRAVLALDSRSAGVLAGWQRSGTLEEALALTGQQLHTGSQAPVLAWWQDHEPATLARTRWLLYCKDWLRLCLTGVIATDTVEASSSVGAFDGAGYDSRALQVFGLADLLVKLPPVRRPADVAGTFTDAAAARTGLRAGTPVVTGTHDVVGSALGSGATVPGDYSVQAGTYSVNQLISSERITDPRWQVRPWVVPGQWVAMGASPSSASNLEWFMRQLMDHDPTPIATANAEVAGVLAEDSSVLFHPFLFGSPYGPDASAAFLGIRSWHRRPHLLRALFEGVVFNHRMHLDALAERTPRHRIHLSGGAARSQVWAQMFADVLACEVAVTDASEHGALGAAMLAGVGAGLFDSIENATACCVRADRVYTPDATQRRRWDDRYRRYLSSIDALKGLWTEDEAPHAGAEPTAGRRERGTG